MRRRDFFKAIAVASFAMPALGWLPKRRIIKATAVTMPIIEYRVATSQGPDAKFIPVTNFSGYIVLGLQPAEYILPPFHPNCRCTK